MGQLAARKCGYVAKMITKIQNSSLEGFGIILVWLHSVDPTNHMLDAKSFCELPFSASLSGASQTLGHSMTDAFAGPDRSRDSHKGFLDSCLG